MQGDTATATMGAMAAFNRKIPVGHLAGRPSFRQSDEPIPRGDRTAIMRLAQWHFAATLSNARVLLNEGVTPPTSTSPEHRRRCPHQTLKSPSASPRLAELIGRTMNQRLVLLTTHRRDNFGETMSAHLRTLRNFADQNPDIAIVFPAHPNPNVRLAAEH